MIFLNLVNNITLLISLSIVHSLIMRKFGKGGTSSLLLSGLLFGCVTIVGMMNPLRLLPGIIFDGRSIIISTAGLFGGPIPALLTVLISASYRLWLGGAGTLMGVSVITESACLGVAYHYLRRKRPAAVRPLHLLGFGFAVHLLMLVCTKALPGGVSADVFRVIAFPVLTIYPFATLLVCILFLDQESRLKAEEALRTSEGKYRELVEHANSVILRWRPDGVITFLNKFGLRLFGYESGEIVGRNLVGSIIPERDSTGQDLKAMVQDIIANPDRHMNHENEAVCRDGRRVWARWSNRPERDADGNLVEFLSVGIDITERKAVEAERKALEEQLRQSHKMEAVGRLAGGVAHDLNNLLSPILGYGEMMLEDNLVNGKIRHNIEEMMKAAKRARDLIRQLMAFGRKQTLDVRPIDINLIVNGFSHLLRRTLREDIHIEFALSPSVLTANVDQGQIEQVLMNLAINAQDAMPNGGVLTIETGQATIEAGFTGLHQGLSPGEFVFLNATDIGEGMSLETQAHIFEPFFTTKELGAGTGLGLSQVYGIVTQHGGGITVRSKPGHGTTFRIFLPTAPEALPPAVDSEQPRDESSVRGTETILIAEDEPIVRELAAEILAGLGYHVITTEHPGQFLRALEDSPEKIDLLLADVVMPEIDGIQFYERLLERWPAMKALFMSGYAANVLASHGLLNGRFEFVQKPFTAHNLGKRVRGVLDLQAAPSLQNARN